MEMVTGRPELAVAVGVYVTPTGGRSGPTEVRVMVCVVFSLVTCTESIANAWSWKKLRPP